MTENSFKIQKNKSNIAMITPFFVYNLGYQEVYIAKALHSMGCNVHVFSSRLVPDGYRARRDDFNDDVSSVPISRYPVRFKFGSSIWVHNTDLINDLIDFNPDLIVIINVPSGFARGVIRSRGLKEIPMITYHSDSKEYRKRDTGLNKLKSIFREMGFRLIKIKWYQEAFKRAEIIVCNTPETKDILEGLDIKNMNKMKMMFCPLGANSEAFYYNEEIRKHYRELLGVNDHHKLIITATKILAHKGIEVLVDKIGNLIKDDNGIKYYLVGGLGDAYSKQLEKHIKKRQMEENIFIIPQQQSPDLNGYYNAADIGLWFYATISIQESMITGVRVIIPNRKVVSHLVRCEASGYLYHSIDEINNELIDRLWKSNRRNVIAENQYLDYKNVLTNIVGLLRN